jgi:hypothetical protein
LIKFFSPKGISAVSMEMTKIFFSTIDQPGSKMKSENEAFTMMKELLLWEENLSQAYI